MKYLVDADVLSEPTKPAPNQALVRWLRRHEAELAISSIVLGEIEYGILLLPAGRRRGRLEEWLAQRVVRMKTLGFDAAAAHAWAQLLARLKRNGQAMPVKDSIIAACALAHRLTIATRNTGDFAKAGVRLVNPFLS